MSEFIVVRGQNIFFSCPKDKTIVIKTKDKNYHLIVSTAMVTTSLDLPLSEVTILSVDPNSSLVKLVCLKNKLSKSIRESLLDKDSILYDKDFTYVKIKTMSIN